MKKYISFLFSLIFVFSVINLIPVYASIDGQDSCLGTDLKYNLKFKDRDTNKKGEVSILQEFLKTRAYLDSVPTGYFGKLTLKALADFQKAYNITPAVGYLGPVTRKKIKELDDFTNCVNHANDTTTREYKNTEADLFVVNVDSGINVSNPKFTVDNNTYSSIDTFLAYMKKLPSGLYKVDISAPGYKPLKEVKIAVPGNLSNNVINLESLTKTHNCPHQPSNTNAFALCGYLADQNHNAIVGAQISSPTFSSISAITDSNGYYDIQFLPLKNYDCGDSAIFTYSKLGYKTLNYILNGPYVGIGEDIGTQLLMTPGSGTEQKIDEHGMCL